MGKTLLIPDDDTLRRMSNEELNVLANSLAQLPNSKRALEYLSDSLIRINHGWRSGAHSEISDTRRRRRITSFECASAYAAGEIVAPVSEATIRAMIRKAAQAGLTRWQQEVWLLADLIGWTQAEIATEYGVSQPAVSQCLKRAREGLWEHIDKRDPGIKIFMAESHRSIYRRPASRPSLPPELDAARRSIEESPSLSTHIQADAIRRVEIWRDGQRPTRVCDREEYALSYTYRQIIARAKKKPNNFHARCYKTSKN